MPGAAGRVQGMFELTEEHQGVRSSVGRFARRELRWRAGKLDAAPPGSVDPELLALCADVGLLSAQLPGGYGGTMDGLGAAIAAEEIACWDAGTAALLMANGQGQAAVSMSGNSHLMDRVFPEIMAAEDARKPALCALALSERHMGSDLQQPDTPTTGRMMVTARRRGNAYALSGRKSYCAAGNAARWIVVFATVSEDRSPEGLTGFLVPTDAPGFHVSEVLPTLGLRSCPLVEFYVENVRVPREHLLTAEGAAAGLVERLIARGRAQAAAVALGIARGAYDLALRHATGRLQGGGPILNHQMVRGKLADMAIRIEAARLLTYKAAACEPPQIGLSSMAKVLASDVAVEAAGDAVQLLGAYGTTRKAGAERIYRDAKMTQILAGANDVCRLAVTSPLQQSASAAT